jgi:hypothetical protein
MFNIGDPCIMSATMLVESSGTSFKSTTSAADNEGLASDFTFDCSLDGTPCNVIAATPMRGSSAVDTMSLKRIDGHTIAAIGWKNGKVVYSDQRIVSADGTTMFILRKGIKPGGGKYETTIVLIRSH